MVEDRSHPGRQHPECMVQNMGNNIIQIRLATWIKRRGRLGVIIRHILAARVFGV